MSKKLLVDYLVFDIGQDQINESMRENDGKLIVKGILQRANSKNQNGRIYPRETLMREADKYHQSYIKDHHPSNTNYSQVNHILFQYHHCHHQDSQIHLIQKIHLNIQ